MALPRIPHSALRTPHSPLGLPPFHQALHGRVDVGRRPHRPLLHARHPPGWEAGFVLPILQHTARMKKLRPTLLGAAQRRVASAPIIALSPDRMGSWIHSADTTRVQVYEREISERQMVDALFSTCADRRSHYALKPKSPRCDYLSVAAFVGLLLFRVVACLLRKERATRD